MIYLLESLGRRGRTDENRHEYNATLFDIGAAWGESYSQAIDTPGAFEWYRRSFIAPEEE